MKDGALKSWLISLSQSNWGRICYNTSTILIALFGGPAIIWTMTFLAQFNSTTDPVPSLTDLPTFEGVLTDVKVNHGHLFSTTKGNIELYCEFRTGGRGWSSGCLDDNLIGLEPLNVTYWPKYEIIMKVSSLTGDQVFLDFDSQKNRINVKNEIISGKYNAKVMKYLYSPYFYIANRLDITRMTLTAITSGLGFLLFSMIRKILLFKIKQELK